MPFIVRKVEPRYLSRGHVPAAGAVDWPCGAELEAVANGALTATLRQLASLLVAAEDVFAELTAELAGIAERSGRLRMRIDRVEEAIGKVDPKKIPVPESDICTFAQRTEHFHSVSLATPARSLFTLDTRPRALKQLYEAAAAVAVRSLDSLRRERDATSSGASALDMFMCTPILGKRRRDQSLDIESRVPRAIEDLRRWTSAEALGDVTVAPDCASRIFADVTTDDRPVDHKLPSPEEQVQAVALKFPAEIVAVDVSGRGFHRMSMRRRSLHTGAAGSQQQQQQDDGTVKRRSRPRRPRGKRRNTIAGTDQKEIRQAVAGETPLDETEEASSGSASKRAHRSASTDLLGTSKKDTSPTEKKSHFNTLKAWGRSRLKLISPKSSSQQQCRTNGSDETTTSPISGSLDRRSTSRHNASTDETEDPQHGTSRRARRDASKSHHHERKPSSSSSSGKSVSSQQQVSTHHHHHNDDDAQSSINEAAEVKDKQQLQLPLQQATSQTASRQTSVRLRESAAERRERRKASSRADEPPHSSSGNWSASSESGRASIGSETTTTTHPPRSTTTASIGTSSTSLSHARRLKGRDTSASSSVTSEGTLTPDIIQDINAVPFSDDGETSSVYSCDTEGYYTSFHVDSGLKTLREEEPLTPVGQHQPQLLPQSPLTRSNEVQSDPTSPVAENEYELFGRGSTSTTTSSAGTVCTTLMAPPPPERKSSLTVVAMVHGGQKQNGGESPDSGHNTSSSPVESASSPACTGRSCSEFEYSESSDLEGCERIERIRSKTAINTSRIPSMCVITPPNSDDEQHKESKPKKEKSNQQQHQQQHQHQQQVLMSATVGTAKMEVINGQDKNLYATVQTVVATATVQSCDKGASAQNLKISPLSGMLGKLRGVLPGKKNPPKPQDLNSHQPHRPQAPPQPDSGDYVTIADVRNNNDKRRQEVAAANSVSTAGVTYANADLFRRDAEYVSLSELPRKPDSSLERRRQGARVILDSDGKVVYSSDSLRRRKGAHTTFIPGPFVKEGPSSPAASPLLHRAQITPRAVTRTSDAVDGDSHLRPNPTPNPPEPTNHTTSSLPQPQQPGKVIIRAAKSPDRDASPDYVRTPATVVGPTGKAAPSRHQGAYVNVQGEEGKTATGKRQNPNKVSSAQSRMGRIREEAENRPPEVISKGVTRVRHPMSLRFRHKTCNSLERKVLKPSLRQVNGGRVADRTAFYPPGLLPNGNTPKLTRKLVTERELVQPAKPSAEPITTPSSDNELPDPETEGITETPKADRKLRRSESYRMANSPIMFIKKLSSSAGNDKKIFRTASEELREDLLKERINYPETVVASPELDDLEDGSGAVMGFDNATPSPVDAITSRLLRSPRPRATDIEPARVLKYSGMDTEIW